MEDGAFLFYFEEKSWTDPMKGHTENKEMCAPLLELKSENLNKNRQGWRTMEKGFKVTRCWMYMLSHPQYGKSKTQKGNGMNGGGFLHRIYR